MRSKVLAASEAESTTVSAASKSILLKHSISCAFILGIALLVNLCIRLDCKISDNLISETSITEWTQQLMLGIAVIAFYRLAAQNKELKNAAVLIAGFFGVLFIRELDFLFDYIHHGFWEYPALVVALGSISFAYKGGKETINQMATIIDKPNMRLLLAGVVLLLFFTRLFGMSSFWQQVMQDNYMREVKNIAEEGTELLCYCLIAFSAVSTQLSFKRAAKK